MDARWTDHNAVQKLSALLFDLVAAENARARAVTSYAESRDWEQVGNIIDNSRSPFAQLNELLAAGSLTVSLEHSDQEEILARHGDGAPFGISKLSDGERNAIIIAAHILTVESGTVLLIDEPERHLHRAIIEPFLAALFEQRSDCLFIISTHEISLPATNSGARVLMPRSCEWNGDQPRAWDIQVLEPDSPLPEDLRLAILGSRRRILFVEGELDSLDQPLYSALFSGISVVSKKGCAGVLSAVRGLRDAFDHHHVEAFGVIDRDDRTDLQVAELAAQGIFALKVCSAEGLYYGAASIKAVAHRQAGSLGTNPDELIDRALANALDALREEGEAERLASKRCERKVREQAFSQLPDARQIRNNSGQSIVVQLEPPLEQEVEQFRMLLRGEDWDGLVARYSVARNSKARGRIVSALQCTNHRNYEQMVLARVRDQNDSLAERLREQVDPLATVLGWDS
jgi:hypothetical protein